MEDKVLEKKITITRGGKREKITQEQALLEVMMKGALASEAQMVREMARIIRARIGRKATQAAVAGAANAVVADRPITEAEQRLYAKLLAEAADADERR